jgi:hypothetical protein
MINYWDIILVFVTPRGSAEIVFSTVARGPPASQIHPLICPTKDIHCIDERKLVT